MANLFVCGLLAHLFADWFLQNEWQAQNKVSLKHPAAYVHSGIHLCALLFVFAWPVAVALAVLHLIIDTRRPLQWWRRTFRMTTDPANPVSLHVAIWQDQVAHILLIGVAAFVQGVQ